MKARITQGGLAADADSRYISDYTPKRQAWLSRGISGGKFVDYNYSSSGNLKEAKQFYNNMDYVGTGNIHYLDGEQQTKEHLHFFAFKKKKQVK